ncbi:MAG: 3-keto-5-aminohexanoate cleavage protein [Hyphomicrobiales bacterium]|nr:3-keto-5-aminohexanoate cleavage protein [Hyphomicrobiales bacterium]
MNTEDRQIKDHKVVLAIAPNGSRRTKADHAEIPLAKADILREAAIWRDEGASVLHLHIRDREGKHSLDPDIYRDVLSALRDQLGRDVILQMTSESGGVFSRERQMQAVRAVRPEAVSLALREFAPQEEHKGEFAAFMDWALAENVAPQIILYDRNDLDRLLSWVADSTLDGANLSVLYVLGRYSAGQHSNPVDLLSFLGTESLPFRDWMTCAFGPAESRCVALSALLGGHVRVGFENNIYLPDGSVAQNNAALLRETAAMLRGLTLKLATAEDVRTLWRIG